MLPAAEPARLQKMQAKIPAILRRMITHAVACGNQSQGLLQAEGSIKRTPKAMADRACGSFNKLQRLLCVARLFRRNAIIRFECFTEVRCGGKTQVESNF